MQKHESFLNDESEDFLSSDDTDNKVPAEVGPNLQKLGDMKPRQFAKSIMGVYRELGGDAWLLTQARENPKEFMNLIKTILPRNVDLNVDQEVFVTIAGRQEAYHNGDKIDVKEVEDLMVTLQ